MTKKSKHPNSILGLHAKEISEKLIDLRFDYMADLFGYFCDQLREVAEESKKNGREKLALELLSACASLKDVAESLDQAWNISKNKVEYKDFDLFENIKES